MWPELQRHAASPDDFIQQKIEEFSRGEWGRPIR
jgi:hypothetical protein